MALCVLMAAVDPNSSSKSFYAARKPEGCVCAYARSCTHRRRWESMPAESNSLELWMELLM